MKSSEEESPGFVDLFTPKLLTVFREGYGMHQLRADAIAGLTVAIVALPLSMAIAIASGANPAQGLYTAIVGGFLVSLLGGSRFQIGGPAGAFIVLVAATVREHGMDGLILATAIAGLILLAVGFLRLGTYIKFIPYPVTVGFTSGIAVIIFASQITELLGLSLPEGEPGPLLEKLPALWDGLPSANPTTIGLSVATIGIIAGFRKFLPRFPGMLIAVIAASIAVAVFHLDVSTIGSKFGEIPRGLPVPSFPDISWAKVREVLPSAGAFALLGAIESLLSAVVADGMTGRRHRSNCELVAQGVANVASAIFGGICVTGTIARTATNVRSGAHGPVAGMLHAVFLFLFMLVAAPLASYIPLASLAGVLAVVAWNMAEKQAFSSLIRASWGDAAVLLATFLLTIFRDLTEAIVVGVALGTVHFIHRMSKSTIIETHDIPLAPTDRADTIDRDREQYDESLSTDPDFVIYRISGAFFFGVASFAGSFLARVPDVYRVLIIDFSAVPFLDSTAANTIEGLVRKARAKKVKIVLTGTSREIRRELMVHGVKPPAIRFDRSIEEAVERWKKERE